MVRAKHTEVLGIRVRISGEKDKLGRKAGREQLQGCPHCRKAESTETETCDLGFECAHVLAKAGEA